MYLKLRSWEPVQPRLPAWSATRSTIAEFRFLMPPKKAAHKMEHPPESMLLQSTQPSPDTIYLRTNVKWAAVTQYLTTFFPAIGVPDYTVQVSRRFVSFEHGEHGVLCKSFPYNPLVRARWGLHRLHVAPLYWAFVYGLDATCISGVLLCG